ncbi:hypothetical protein PRZ48_009892 [Zasmidium cellare]|uniref:RING-type domain-containing protein n=1 Tax=Zasmidium cellare TaxID=395010 RepID=A0ABR0EE18_ZASCE|nr:hypothetical protein PRZ48_009892 [Zasmidium cellare]
MSSPPNPLPTVRDFILNGWTPVHTSITCPICCDTATLPVHLPCHSDHIFCIRCIVSWLLAPGIDSCPICRTVLFNLSYDEEPLLDYPHLMDRVRDHLGGAHGDLSAFDFLLDQVARERDELGPPRPRFGVLRLVDCEVEQPLTPQWQVFVATEQAVAVVDAWFDAEDDVRERFRRSSDTELMFAADEGDSYGALG